MPKRSGPKIAASKPNTVQRKIMFYKIKCTAQDTKGEAVAFRDYDALFKHIQTLPFVHPSTNPPATRYLPEIDGSMVAITDTENRDGHIQGVIGTHRNLLPDVERLGKLQPLILSPDEGIFEATHFVFFADDDILGIEYNFHGPRTGRFAHYLFEKCRPLVTDVNFIPLVRGDVLTRLRKSGDIVLFRLAIEEAGFDTTGLVHASLPQALKMTQELAENPSRAGVVEVVLRNVPRSRQGFKLSLDFKKLRQFLRNSQARDTVRVFQAKAQNPKTREFETFDLLKDQLIITAPVEVSGGRSRSLRRDSMLGAIESSFEMNREKLIGAESITDDA